MNSERFNRAYNALVKAYFEGTLAKGDCKCCAVGNIVADAEGANLELDDFYNPMCDRDVEWWSYLFFTDRLHNQISRFPHSEKAGEILDHDYLASRLLRLTGYSEQEMAKIEYAFEINTDIHIDQYLYYTKVEILEDQYKGLAAVVDVMMELDNMAPDPQYKAKFREHKTLQNI